MKKLFIISLIFIFFLSLALAHEHNFNETKQLIDSGINCTELSDEQLEAIGDYYMEQMHPGEAHELMDKMMGGKGSESLKQVHINMAKGIYCGEQNSGMMSMMSMMSGNSGMMGGNMMGNYGTTNKNLVGNSVWSYSWWLFLWLFMLLIIVALILLIIWLIKQIQKENKKKNKK